MNREYYHNLTDQSLNDEKLSNETALEILTNESVELLALLNAAYNVRKETCGKEVTIHIINNGQNGYCPEDCSYCAQGKSSKATIEEYPLKSDQEFLAEAKNAHEKGAHRYCMVFAGRGPSTSRVNHLAKLIKEIKSNYPLEVCVSAGLLNNDKAKILKEAGLDRLNHNLNTSEKHYSKICSTHTYEDRINTLKSARNAGIQLCSGVIIGMDESHEDIIEVAFNLRKMKVESIPVNFLIPIEGNALDQHPNLTPEYCLRVLSLFRFLNPKAEIRIAAGREIHLRSMEVLGLYPANSLFLDGYLNAKGEERKRVYQMIKDAGFKIKSDQNIDQLIDRENPTATIPSRLNKNLLKDLEDLRPHHRSQSL